MSNWEVAFWLLMTAGLALLPWVTESRPTTTPTPVDQWAYMYRICAGSNPTDQQRAACIAAADRVLACAGQKEGKHE